MFTFVLLALIVLILLVYKKYYETFSYWSRKGVKGPKPHPFFGNLTEAIWPQNHSIITLAANIYNDHEEEKVVGIYQGLTPTLLVRDPEIIKKILINEFSKFPSRGLANQRTATHLFMSEKDEWKTRRANMLPLFTTSKLKEMVSLLNPHVDEYMKYVDGLVSNSPTAVEIRKLKVKYTTKSFCSVIFGIDFDTFRDEATIIENIGNEVVSVNLSRFKLYILSSLLPVKMVKYLSTRVPSVTYSFFDNLVKQLCDDRETEAKNRQDFFGKLMSLKNKSDDDTIRITDDHIVLETMFFFGASFDAASSTMSLLIHELALNPKIQSNCQKEIDAVMKKYNDKLDYDSITKDLQYLSMAIDETLRKYPVAGILLRESSTDYTFEELNLTIAKGTKLWISPLGLQKDPKYYPEPEKFDPDRFLPENRQKYIDYYYPFGGGPRICIGLRFANVWVLLLMAHFLHKFQVSPCEKTSKKISFDPSNGLLTPKGGIWLNVEKRNRCCI